MEKEKSCAFTGHREIADYSFLPLLESSVRTLIGQGVEVFYCGMAMGFDLVAAETVLKIKKQYPAVKIIACVPCPGQEKYYPAEEKKKYKEILPLCDEVKLLGTHYFNGCMIARDRYMVDNSSHLIAYLRKSGKSGTAYTVNYARSCGRSIKII